MNDRSIDFFIKSVLAGIMIGIGGIAKLQTGGLTGSILFSVGLFAVCTQGFPLFTGQVCYKNRPARLLLILIANLIGASLAAVLAYTAFGSQFSFSAGEIVQAKLSLSPLQVLSRSILCDIMIFLAVDSYKRLNDAGRYIGIFLGVTVFVACGFDHCVANMFYIVSAIGTRTFPFFSVLLFLLLNIIGNSIGGMAVSLMAGRFFPQSEK